jgi:predicted component of type VI protein secretion system
MFAKLRMLLARLLGATDVKALEAAAEKAERDLRAKVTADLKAAYATAKTDADKGLAAILEVLARYGIKVQ